VRSVLSLRSSFCHPQTVALMLSHRVLSHARRRDPGRDSVFRVARQYAVTIQLASGEIGYGVREGGRVRWCVLIQNRSAR
jgi:hypothetical protein